MTVSSQPTSTIFLCRFFQLICVELLGGSLSRSVFTFSRRQFVLYVCRPCYATWKGKYLAFVCLTLFPEVIFVHFWHFSFSVSGHYGCVTAFHILCHLLLQVYYTLLTRSAPSGDPRARDGHTQKTAIKSSGINIFFCINLLTTLALLKTAKYYKNIKFFQSLNASLNTWPQWGIAGD